MVERNTKLMADYEAKVAPFIDKVFYVTAQAGVYPSRRLSFGYRFINRNRDKRCKSLFNM